MVVGTHADKLNKPQARFWKNFVVDVSQRCSETVSVFLLHNFQEHEFKLPEKNLEKVWKTLSGAFMCDPSNPLKTRATPAQHALLSVLERVRASEHFAVRQAESGFGLVDLFNQHSLLV